MKPKLFYIKTKFQIQFANTKKWNDKNSEFFYMKKIG